MNIKDILNNLLLEEEFDIGTYISNGGIWEVECFTRGEREIPHLHLKTPKNQLSAPMLDRENYFIHDNKRYILNSKEKKDFERFMNCANKDKPNLTNWQVCVSIWNLTHKRKISMNLEDKPNYTNLPNK